MSKTVRAHTNIALIKYWGKKDEARRIPWNSSISMTLDKFYTDTTVNYDASLTQDILILDNEQVNGSALKRVSSFMDTIRSRYGIKEYARIITENHVPTAAGLASSASAFCALAKAATLDLGLSDIELSRLARMGSGSASRSVYGGFVKWNKGTDDEDSFATPIDMPLWDDFIMIACIVNDKEKPFSSSEAMDTTTKESAYFAAWVEQTEKDIIQMEDALIKRDIHEVGQLAQANALRMHASLMAVNMWYFEPMTLEIMNTVRALQQTIPVYFTMDAGPNVKLLTLKQHINEVLEALGPNVETVVSAQGPGVSVL